MKCRTTHTLILGAVAGLALCAASCIAQFKNPLPLRKGTKPDGELLGAWAGTGESDGTCVRFYPLRKRWLDIVFSEQKKKDGAIKTDETLFEGYSVPIGNLRVLCFRAKEPGDKHNKHKRRKIKTDYMIMPYKIDENGNLRVWELDLNLVASLVEEKKLKGEVSRGKFMLSVTVTSSSDNLAEVLAKEADLITEPLKENSFMKFERAAKEKESDTRRYR